jgi:osmotically-inducible protein OsmY
LALATVVEFKIGRRTTMLKKSLLTLALSCGLMALPALAQSSAPSVSDQQAPSTEASGQQSNSAAQTQQPAANAPSGTVSSQNSMAGQQGSMDQSATPQSAGSADSATMQSNIQSALQKDDQLAGQSINVNVNSKNQVVLTGTVSTQAQKDHAEQVATQTAGAGTMVKNHIKVSGGATGSTGSTTPPQK